MPKFIIILIIAFITDAEIKKSKPEATQRLASIVFSEEVLDYESGQPVFSKEVKPVLLRRSNGDGARVIINDLLDMKIESEVIELNELLDLEKGTYTVIIETNNNERETFGFTIR